MQLRPAKSSQVKSQQELLHGVHEALGTWESATGSSRSSTKPERGQYIFCILAFRNDELKNADQVNSGDISRYT